MASHSVMVSAGACHHAVHEEVAVFLVVLLDKPHHGEQGYKIGYCVNYRDEEEEKEEKKSLPPADVEIAERAKE